MRLPFLVAFVLSVLLLVASKADASSGERIDLRERISVDVVRKTDGGEWVARKAEVHGYADGRILVCVEYPNNVMADCLVLIDEDKSVVVVGTRLLEEKI